MDATLGSFRGFFSVEERCPDWIVTSPPYMHALTILKQAIAVAGVGVSSTLRLTFLEPTIARGSWLAQNPPDKSVVLPRATYRGRKCCSTEAWSFDTKKRCRAKKAGDRFVSSQGDGGVLCAVDHGKDSAVKVEVKGLLCRSGLASQRFRVCFFFEAIQYVKRIEQRKCCTL